MLLSLNNRSASFDFPDEFVTYMGENYELGESIGQGGNAVICECYNQSGDVLAVKFLLHTSKKSRQRFIQEINLLKKIKHHHVVRYIDNGEITVTDNRGRECLILFVIMDRADSNLLEYMKNNKGFGYEIYAPQIRGLCEALSNLHGVAIHRDIKPENILIKGETWLLSDFGLCSFINDEDHLDITGDTEKIGPKYWLSPEAINKIYFLEDEIDAQSDVFQLCAVFWFVVTFRHPMGLLDKEDWPNSHEKIYEVLCKSLSHDKTKRPQNGEELFNLMREAMYV